MRLDTGGILGAVEKNCRLPWHTLSLLYYGSAELLLPWVLQLFVDCSGTHSLLKSPKTFLICEATIQPFHSDVSCMRSCTVLLEPLLLSIHVTIVTECPPELVQNHNVTLFIDCHCFLQHHSQTRMVSLCYVLIWQTTQCFLQSAVVSGGLYLVLEIPIT